MTMNVFSYEPHTEMCKISLKRVSLTLFLRKIYFKKWKNGGHFEIQKAVIGVIEKKWNPLQSCLLGSKDAKDIILTNVAYFASN